MHFAVIRKKSLEIKHADAKSICVRMLLNLYLLGCKEHFAAQEKWSATELTLFYEKSIPSVAEV